MSNTIQIKRGSSTPTVNDLSNYELGYNTSTKNLFIKDGEQINQLSTTIIEDSITFNIPTVFPELNKREIVITFSDTVNFESNQNIFITLGEGIESEELIKAFNKLNLYFLEKESRNQLRFKVLGSLPSQSVSVPLKLVIINR